VPKITEERVAIGALIAFAFWIFVFLPLYYFPNDQSSKKCSKQEYENYGFWGKTRCDPVAYFTIWLVGFTGLLAVSTSGLWYETMRSAKRQEADTRILQRAYVSVAPRSIHYWDNDPTKVIAHLAIINRGNLPARKLKNNVKITWHHDGELDVFETVVVDPYEITLLPGDEIERGTGKLSEEGAGHFADEAGYIYVFGRVEYEDGFGEPRWMIFCNRYPCADPSKVRRHHHHNDGN
jgi:hypothetical protein